MRSVWGGLGRTGLGQPLRTHAGLSMTTLPASPVPDMPSSVDGVRLTFSPAASGSSPCSSASRAALAQIVGLRRVLLTLLVGLIGRVASVVGSLSISASLPPGRPTAAKASQLSEFPVSATSGTSGRFSAVSTARALNDVQLVEHRVLPAVQQVLLVPHLAPPQGELLPCSVVDGRGLMPRSIDDAAPRPLLASTLRRSASAEHLAADLGCVLRLLGQVLAGCPLQLGRLGQHRLHGVIRRCPEPASSSAITRSRWSATSRRTGRTVAFSGGEEFLRLEAGGLAHAGGGCFGLSANGARPAVEPRPATAQPRPCALPQLQRILLTALSQSVQLGQLSVPQLGQFRCRGSGVVRRSRHCTCALSRSAS